MQHINYGEILSKLKHKDKPHTKRPPIIQQLGLYLELQVDTIDAKEDCTTRHPYDRKYPVMIPAESYLATLIVRDTLSGKTTIPLSCLSSITKNKSHRIPTLSHHQSWLWRPIIQGNNNNKVTKVYICLFTCTAIWVIHLNIVEDQTASSFSRAIRLFITRRGIPEYIISDNSKTFKAGSQELLNYPQKPNTKHSRTSKVSCSPPDKWKFITERAPWWGGFYKWLIWLVKQRLKKLSETLLYSNIL